MSGGQSTSQFVEQLIKEARASGQVSEAVIRQRKRLFELSASHPEAVLAYCKAARQPFDDRVRELLGRVCEVAARAQFEQRVPTAHA